MVSGSNTVPPPLWSGDPTEADLDEDLFTSASASSLDESVDDTLMMPAPIGMLVGEVLAGRYEIVGVLGEGGMGHVYEAHDTEQGIRCALKILNQEVEEFAARFEREIRVISSIDSPFVVQILGAGSTRTGQPFLVEELLVGETLGQALSGGPIEPARARAILDCVLQGLAAAHRVGVVHRDLKPDNIFLLWPETPIETAKVLDFGFAVHVDELDRRLTAVGMAVGTPKYMAPEQFLQGQIGGRADLYACGVLFHRMLYGRAPFEEGDEVPAHVKKMAPPARMGWMHIYQAPRRCEGLPPGHAEFIARLLAKDPDQRFADAEATRAALAALGARPVAAPPAERGTVNVPPPRPRRAQLSLALLALVSVGLAAAATWMMFTR